MVIRLPFLPDRTEKPRNTGITMMMDKGLSVAEVDNFIENSAPFTDLVKLVLAHRYSAVTLKRRSNFIIRQVSRFTWAVLFLKLSLFGICLKNM